MNPALVLLDNFILWLIVINLNFSNVFLIMIIMIIIRDTSLILAGNIICIIVKNMLAKCDDF